MSNISILNATYDLTGIISKDAINDTAQWFANINTAMGGVMVITFMAVLGIALFLIVRKVEGVSDSEGAVYAGLIVSVVAVFLYLVKVTGPKLVVWSALVPIFVITALAIGVNYFNKRF